MRDFRELEFWRRSHELTLEIYLASQRFPQEERFGLTAQIRRAMMSIPSNIAEGCGRNSAPDFGRFLDIAMGSASEVEYQLLLAKDLQYIESENYEKLSAELIVIKKMLNTYIQRLRPNN